MKEEIISREVIKPASPSYDRPRTIQLPISGHLIPPIYATLVLFYNTEREENVTLRLKESLSQTLNRFHLFAGRIHGVNIICNDEGVVFTEARSDRLLSEFLRNPDLDSVEQLLPSDFTTSSDPPEKWPLLHVKVSLFRAGGVAVGLCLSHKVCDAATLSVFVSAWTGTAKGNADAVCPEFSAPSFLPSPEPYFDFPVSDERFDVGKPCAKKRFVFDASKIAELKRRAASMHVPDPTRVEAISGLIWRCTRKASSSSIRPMAMTQAMDYRRIIPSTHLPQNSMGNLVFAFLLKAGPGNEIEIQENVAESRKAKERVKEMINENLSDDRTIVTLSKKMTSTMVNNAMDLMGEVDAYNVTSWCRLAFYEADFGWGNPVWIAPGTVFPNQINDVGIILIDAKDGEGIEAFVSLLERDMFAFERDRELLAFATPNPCIPTDLLSRM